MHVHTFPSELGWMAITWDGEKLTRLTFGHPSASAAALSLAGTKPGPESTANELPSWVQSLVARLQSYAAGCDERFDDVPLALERLSTFQSRVVKACRGIRRGRVRTYGELAASVGAPGAARAVGTVMAKNRFPIIVPCHRVVGSSGSLGGFSADGGVSVKQRMLEMEGVVLKKAASARIGTRRSGAPRHGRDALANRSARKQLSLMGT